MRLVQEAPGHEDLRATRIYIDIVNEQLEEAMKT
jgi:site-specific recombinase XerD